MNQNRHNQGRPQQHRQGSRGGGRGGGGERYRRGDIYNDLQGFNLLTEDSESFSKMAEDIGQKWSDHKVPSSQVRKYYGEVRRIHQKVVESKQDGWSKYELEFKLLKAKATYALRPEMRSEVGPLVDYIKWAAENVKSEQLFKRFVIHYEAVVAFATGFGLKKD